VRRDGLGRRSSDRLRKENVADVWVAREDERAASRDKPAPPPRVEAALEQVKQQAMGTVGAPAAEELELAPTDPAAARALLIICYDRPAYLTRTLSAVLDRLPLYNRPHVYVSQVGRVRLIWGAALSSS
jgi:hypothetical protein